MATPNADAIEVVVGATVWVDSGTVPLETTIRIKLISRIAPALIAVVQFCKSALRRVPITLTITRIPITKTETAFCAIGVRGTKCARFILKATESAEIPAELMTKNSAHP